MITRIPTVDHAIAINALVTNMSERSVQTSVKLGLLDSALQAPMSGFGTFDQYPADHQRLGVICSRIVLNHPFIDGNKRTGFLLMLETASRNGLTVNVEDQHRIAEMIDQLAARTLSEDQCCECIKPMIG